MGLDEMTGSPNLTIVPDPSTFRVLPWAPGVGWVLCDEYFNSGVPFHFSPRQLLRQAAQAAGGQGHGLRRRPGDRVVSAARRGRSARAKSTPASGRARAADRRPAPVEPGFSYHSESNMDLMQPVLSALAERSRRSDCRCDRSRTSGDRARSSAPSPRGRRWKPPTTRCCFAPRRGRSAGAWAISPPSCAGPALKGYYSSGWHLHQSLVDAQERPQPVHAGARARMPVAARPRFSRRA